MTYVFSANSMRYSTLAAAMVAITLTSGCVRRIAEDLAEAIVTTTVIIPLLATADALGVPLEPSAADTATSGFSTAAADGSVILFLNEDTSRVFQDEDGQGYAFKGGLISNGEYATVAALSGPALAPPTITGTAQFTGTASAIYANTNLSANRSVRQLASPISVTAYLDAGTFQAETTPATPGPLSLSLDGQIAKGQMTGTGQFTYNFVTIDTVMQGQLGDQKTIGVFHGAGTAVSVAGGFYATQ